LGNDRTIEAGGLQRITAGRGIQHAEMPGQEGVNHGLQLWINLPRRLKGVEPEYQEVEATAIPEDRGRGFRVRTVVGDGSPVRLHTPVLYLDVTVEAGQGWESAVPSDHRGFVYVLTSRGEFGPRGDVELQAGQLLLLEEGEPVRVRARGSEPLRFVLVTGRPHGEPMRLWGPFVD
ncbi:MAG: pirin family protein, partial [Clostridia bacterium]|nr:pirin family protein [Clostridia bacterium]